MSDELQMRPSCGFLTGNSDVELDKGQSTFLGCYVHSHSNP